MRRREFVANASLIAASVPIWPLAMHAQQPAVPVVGYLYPGTPQSAETLLPAFRKGLGEVGYVEPHNVAIELRAANSEFTRLPELLADLVRRRVAAIAVFGGAAFAVKDVTTTIPIVFNTGADPVRAGLVGSLNHPGDNITGITTMSLELAAKRLGLVHDLLPQASHFAILVNPNQPASDPSNDIQAAASARGWQIDLLEATTNREIDTAFASLVKTRVDALFISASSLFRDRAVQLATLAARRAVPAIYVDRGFPEAGGLMSYGASFLIKSARPAPMSAGSSRARRLLTFRCSRQRGSSWSSICRRPRYSASTCRPDYSLLPTR